MGSFKENFDALELETQAKINRQLLNRIEALEKDNAEFKQRIVKLEGGQSE